MPAFEELSGSPQIRVAQDGVSAVRTFRVAWADWQEFARLVLGTFRVVGGVPQFVPPIQFPGLRNLLVAEIAVEPLDPDSPDGLTPITLGARTNTYAGGAKVTVVYRTLFDDGRSRPDLPAVPTGTYLIYRGELGAEYQHVPGRIWRWSVEEDPPPVPDDVHPGLLIPTGSVQLTWLRVPLPPWSAMRALRGKVNAATFLGSPPGTVLFLGMKAVREFQFLEDDGLWRLDYYFSEQTKELSNGAKVGWNYYYKEEAVEGEHWVAISDADGNPPYVAASFAPLFQFE